MVLLHSAIIHLQLLNPASAYISMGYICLYKIVFLILQRQTYNHSFIIATDDTRNMMADELIFRIRQELGFAPTEGQDAAIHTFAQFFTDRTDRPMMLLRGSAGTGKTSLAAAIVRALVTLKQKTVLLAPTGRAAKVFALNSGHAAFTIHRKTYRQRTFGNEMADFRLNDNLHTDTLFMVDEASMVANDGAGGRVFGSGRLLDDLVAFVYAGRNCRLLLIGDRAQLPPVGEERSPALDTNFMQGYGATVYDYDLDEVLRQAAESGILFNATSIRRLLTRDAHTQLPFIRLQGFADICRVPGDELIETLASSFTEVGIDETMVITRSNKRANIYNQGIRNSVLGCEEELTTGDVVMVVKNNYYWTEREKSPIPFIANGDRAIVQQVRHEREVYGFRFADVWLRFPDYDNYELSTTVVLDSLRTEAPALTPAQNEALYLRVMEDYSDLSRKADRMQRLRQDEHYNAIQVKYGYAVTCHKAQGGQWAHIYLDQGYMTEEMLTPDYIHWLYTAFTRATERLFLVNWPTNQCDVDED